MGKDLTEITPSFSLCKLVKIKWGDNLNNENREQFLRLNETTWSHISSWCDSPKNDIITTSSTFTRIEILQISTTSENSISVDVYFSCLVVRSLFFVVLFLPLREVLLWVCVWVSSVCGIRLEDQLFKPGQLWNMLWKCLSWEDISVLHQNNQLMTLFLFL